MKKLELLKNSLLYLVEGINGGNTTFTDEECDALLDVIKKAVKSDDKLSKYQACKYLNVSRATFDNWVRDGKIPEGRKEAGFKEKFWFKEDLMKLKDSKTCQKT